MVGIFSFGILSGLGSTIFIASGRKNSYISETIITLPEGESPQNYLKMRSQWMDTHAFGEFIAEAKKSGHILSESVEVIANNQIKMKITFKDYVTFKNFESNAIKVSKINHQLREDLGFKTKRISYAS